MAESNAKLPPNLPPSGGNISPITIEAEMQKSYLDYAMSVIVSRALPDVRDGLKPVHRRILYAMQQGGYDSSKPYKKSARIVGDVMGKYHPHGDSAIYDAMVRMVQDFSMRVPLIDGQGNFGSMDDDPAAAMRYTEARLAKSAEAHLIDIEKDTVDYQPNYDDSDLEPTVLPARFPNLLVNGASGIAVGMATNIPPHNLGEVVDACCAMMANPAITDQEIYAIVPAPDFPTGAMILGRQGSLAFHSTGHGSIKMRGRTSIEEVRKDKMAIIIHDVPYQVNKARLIERIAEVVNEKIVEGITDVRDESDRDGVRVVVELRRDAQPDVVLNQLFKYTPLQTSFGGNLLALNRGRPERLTLRQTLQAFLDFRVEVITRRTKFELAKARDRAHILAGLAVAVANVDPIIACIRQAPDPVAAKEALLAQAWPVASVQPLLEKLHDPNFNATDKTYRLSEVQAKAILELRLQRLTGLERDKIANELDEVVQDIARLLSILNDRVVLNQVLVDELQEVKAKFGTPRRTEIIDAEHEDDIEDLIASEDMVVTVSHAGYIKRVPLATYRAQNRGGKGRAAANLKDDDVVTDVFVANTLTPLLFFTTKGIVHSLKVYKLPLANPQARGKALVNMLPLAQDEKISVVLPMPDTADGKDEQMNMLFATSHGTVRRNRLSDFRNIRSNGLIAMKLGDDERLISVKVAADDQDVLLFSRNGKAIRFAIDELRVFAGRTSTGVRGINLSAGDEVIGMSVLKNVPASSDERTLYLKLTNAERRLISADESETPATPSYDSIVAEAAQAESMTEARYQELTAMEEYLLTVTDRGFGKRTSAFEYRQTGRGGQGITNIDLTDKNGVVVASYPVDNGCDLLLVTDAGQMIRTPANQIRVAGRATQGVTLFRVAADEKVVSVEVIGESDDDTTNADEVV